jgi:uncharacterized DUF497 family protein
MFVFDWDDDNRAKCLKHGVSHAEIEQAICYGARVAPYPKHSLAEQRFIAVGRTDQGRHVFVAFRRRGDRVRPISARFIHAREVARYEDAQGPVDDDG